VFSEALLRTFSHQTSFASFTDRSMVASVAEGRALDPTPVGQLPAPNTDLDDLEKFVRSQPGTPKETEFLDPKTDYTRMFYQDVHRLLDAYRRSRGRPIDKATGLTEAVFKVFSELPLFSPRIQSMTWASTIVRY